MTAAGVVASPTPYQLLPRLTDEEYAALHADIAEHGIRVPIDVDEDGTVIDGHHRAWIAADLNIDCPRRVVTGLTDEQKRAHAVAVNIHRRNLTRDQRRELIGRLRREGMSLPRIAKAVGVSVDTAHRDTQASDIGSLPTRVTGSDGKTYPASRRGLAPAEPVDRTTGEIGARRAPTPPRRPALVDEFSDAISGLSRAVERVRRLVDDDRFPRNAEQIAARYCSDVARASEALARVRGELSNTPTGR